MSASQNPPPNPPEPGAAPTLAQLQEIAQGAAEAVSRATSAAEAATAAATSIREQADRMNLTIPDEIVQMISDQAATAVIAQLRAVGALSDESGTPPAGTPPTPPATLPTGEGGTPPATPPPGGAPPRRPTFAERFLGGR